MLNNLTFNNIIKNSILINREFLYWLITTAYVVN